MKISPKFIFGSAGLLGVLAIMTDSNIQAKVSRILPSFLKILKKGLLFGQCPAQNVEAGRLLTE